MNAADDVISTLSSRVSELSKRVAMLQAELESATKRLAIYEEHDTTLQDALSSALRAAYQIRERAEVAGGQILEQAREERRMLLSEIERLRDERDQLQEEIATQRRGSIAAVSPHPLSSDRVAEELRSVASEALKGIFREIADDMRSAQERAPQTRAEPTSAARAREVEIEETPEEVPAPPRPFEEIDEDISVVEESELAEGPTPVGFVEVEEAPTYEAMARVKREAHERAEAERAAAEAREAEERAAAERADAERREAEERAQAERVAAERAAAEAREAEERAVAERAEAQRAAEQRAAAERAARERAAAERAAAERAEEQRVAEQRAAEQRAAAERAEAERAAAAARESEERAATERAQAEQRAAEERAGAERAAAERASADRAAAEARAAAEQAAADRAAAEARASTERAAAERAAAERAAVERDASDARAAAERAAAEREAAEHAAQQAAADRAARERAAEVRMAEERRATERAAAERAAAERATAERAAAERAAAERAAAERVAAERAAAERQAAERAAAAAVTPARPPLELVRAPVETGEIASTRVEAASPTSDIQLVLTPITSFPRLVEIERHIQALPVVRTLYVRDFRGGIATLAVTLRSAMTPEDFAATLSSLQRPRLRLTGGSRNRLDLRVEGEASIA